MAIIFRGTSAYGHFASDFKSVKFNFLLFWAHINNFYIIRKNKKTKQMTDLKDFRYQLVFSIPYHGTYK